MHLFFPISIGFMLVSEWMYPLLFNADFADSAAVFNVYLLLVVSRLVFPQTLLIGLKKAKTIMLVAGLELSVNFGLSILFVHQFGLVGIAFATVIAEHIRQTCTDVLAKIFRRRISPTTYWPLEMALWIFGGDRVSLLVC
jgi:O-antigen/teichoic acid export membrane protein